MKVAVPCDAVTQLLRTANWVGSLSTARLRRGTPSVAAQCRALVLETVDLTRALCAPDPALAVAVDVASPCPPDSAVPPNVGEWAIADQLQVVAADLAEVLVLRDQRGPLPVDVTVVEQLCALAQSCVAIRSS